MTPFYQPPPSVARQPSRGSSDAVTPGSRRLESPTQAHSGINHHSGLSSIPGLTGPSPPGVVPFGRLIQTQQHLSSNLSNMSSNSYSSRRNRLSPATSPLSTPPSSSPGLLPTHHGGGGPGNKGGLSRHNSGTKLSALTEEREERRKMTKKGGGDTSGKISSGGFEFISQSCLLDSSGDENSGAVEFEEEEEDFPLTMSLNSNPSTDQEDNDREEQNYPATALTNSGHTLQFMGLDVVHFALAQSQPMSSGTSRRENGKARSTTRRAASFSHQRNPRLSQQLAAVNTKASKLSTHGDPFDPSCLATPSLTSSLSAEIIAFKAPFVFPGSSSSANNRSPMDSNKRAPQGREAAKFRGGGGSGAGEDEEEVIVCFGSLKLPDLKDYLVIAEEMHAMAKARQGPILLMSTSADLVRSPPPPPKFQIRAKNVKAILYNVLSLFMSTF